MLEQIPPECLRVQRITPGHPSDERSSNGPKPVVCQRHPNRFGVHDGMVLRFADEVILKSFAKRDCRPDQENERCPTSASFVCVVYSRLPSVTTPRSRNWAHLLPRNEEWEFITFQVLPTFTRTYVTRKSEVNSPSGRWPW